MPVDLNEAFAKHWDRKNPSNFVQACDESRRLREDEIFRKEARDNMAARILESHTIPQPKEKPKA
jgi:hypothetical protein